jgi:hypothetical protein
MLENHSDGLGLCPANKVLGARERPPFAATAVIGKAFRGCHNCAGGLNLAAGCSVRGKKQTRRRRKCYSRGRCRRQSSAPHLLLLLIAGARVLAQANPVKVPLYINQDGPGNVCVWQVGVRSTSDFCTALIHGLLCIDSAQAET